MFVGCNDVREEEFQRNTSDFFFFLFNQWICSRSTKYITLLLFQRCPRLQIQRQRPLLQRIFPYPVKQFNSVTMKKTFWLIGSKSMLSKQAINYQKIGQSNKKNSKSIKKISSIKDIHFMMDHHLLLVFHIMVIF